MSKTSIEKLYSIFLEHPLICTDSREIKKGGIFFALKGGNFNGNLFAEQAIKDGCVYAVIDEQQYLPGRQADKKDEKFILVPDVLKTLQQLANFHRRQLLIPVIAITGSNGKTTSKELISAVLNKKFNTLSTKGNLNNHIGVPLTLLSIRKEHQMAVVEMGANHQKEIEMLCNIAEPDYGVITNIGRAHLEGFGGPQGVIKAKGEMYDHIRKHGGKIFINADNEVLLKLSEGINDPVTYGTSESYNCFGTFLEANPFVKLKWGETTINSQLIGKYNFENILLSICIGSYFGIDALQIKNAIENYVPSNNRSQVVKKESNTILMDAYNANPTSMVAAIENFDQIKESNKILVLGDMLELGSESANEHQQIVDLIQNRKFAKTILVGDWFAKTNNRINANIFLNVDMAIDWLKVNPIKNSTILIKGSRGIRLEKILDSL
jgi:UDP-N-acetylmuramoyl-tripeptide--D-alanyl-D-alanine ligase